MNYSTHIKRALISLFNFLSLALWALYAYFKLWDFAKAAKSLHYINVQTVSFIVYSLLLVLFPLSIICSPRRSKKNLFKTVCFAIATSLLIGAVGDVITYNFFKGYTFVEGDAIFCNIVVSIPNMYGVLCCLALSALYALLGVCLVENRFISFFLYLTIVLIISVPPFVYSFNMWGGFPRQTWAEKAVFLISHQGCLLISLLLASTSEFLWGEWIS